MVSLQELARKPDDQTANTKKQANSQAKPKNSNNDAQPAPEIEAPDWWKKLTPAGRDTYLRNHPKSKLDHFLRQELKKYLAAHPEDRKTLRKVIKEISSDPDKTLKGDFDKMAQAAKKPVPKKQKKIIEDAVKKTNKTKKSKNILKAVVATMAVAGVLTVGAGIVAAGGLPYLIIGPRLIKDTVSLVKDINTRIHDGQDTVKATFAAVSTAFQKAASDPHMLAAALMLQQRRNRKRDDANNAKQKQKVTSAKKGNVTNKKQQKADIKNDQNDQPKQKQKQPPQPKQKPHNSNAVS